MKVLVAYMSKTGNTRKVAEAIYGEITDEKEIKTVDAVDSIAGYDLAFLGFPMHVEGPDKQPVKLLKKHCINGRDVVLFITHASPEDNPALPPMLDKFRQAACGANIVDMFDCQGELAKSVKWFMSVYPNAKYRQWARQDNSQGQPDQSRLDRARAFSRNVMRRLHDIKQDIKIGAANNRRNMRIEYFHASRYGNGAMVAEEFKKQMSAKGAAVNVHHIRHASPKELPPADLYLFSSPGRMGKPIGSVRHFLKDVRLPSGTRYAILTTQAAPRPDRKTGRIPTEEEQARWQHIIPVMNEILQEKGLVKTTEGKILVTGLKGPLEEGWKEKVEAFASQIPLIPGVPAEESLTNSPVVSVA